MKYEKEALNLLKQNNYYELLNSANWEYCLTKEAAFALLTALNQKSLLKFKMEYTEVNLKNLFVYLFRR